MEKGVKFAGVGGSAPPPLLAQGVARDSGLGISSSTLGVGGGRQPGRCLVPPALLALETDSLTFIPPTQPIPPTHHPLSMNKVYLCGGITASNGE